MKAEYKTDGYSPDTWMVYDEAGRWIATTSVEALAQVMVESLIKQPYSGKEVKIMKFTDEYALNEWGRLNGNYVCADQDELNLDYPMLLIKDGADDWNLVIDLHPSVVKELREALDSLKED